MKYRMIDVENLVVSEEHYPNIAQILKAEGWGPAPAKTTEQGEVSLCLAPMEARESIQVLKEIAPWVATHSHVILEQETVPVTWLHLIYADGQVTEEVTPAHQWEATE